MERPAIERQHDHGQAAVASDVSEKGVALAVACADWHTNSKVGLNPPSLLSELGSRYVVGKVGRALWQCWLEFCGEVQALKQQYKATVYTFLVGDLGDRNKKDPSGIITQVEAEIEDAMAEVADPIARVSDHVFVCRGTETHVGPNGRLEEWLARDLDNAEWYSDEVASWWVVDARIGGLNFQATHRPPVSGHLPWTIDQAASRAASVVAGSYLDEARRDPSALRRMPHICFWAHVHPPRGLQGRGMSDVWGFVLPPWQLATSYAHHIGKGAGPRNVGGVWLLVENGSVVDWGWRQWPMRPRQAWKA